MKQPFLRGVVSVVVFLGCVSFLWFFRNDFQLRPWDRALSYEYPGFAASDSQGSIYLIDRSQKRIVKASAQGVLDWTITGGSRDTGSFYFADELTVGSDGSVYVLNRVPDAPGFYTVKTQILQYRQDGTFARVVAEKQYPETERTPSLVQRGQWHSLQFSASGLSWFDSTNQGLFLFETRDSQVSSRIVVSDPSADLLIPSSALLPDGSVAYVTKSGQIRQTGNPERVLWDASSAEATSIPWKIRCLADGSIAFTDLGRLGVALLKKDGQGPLVYEAQAPVYSLSVSADGNLATTGDPGVVFLSASGPRTESPTEALYSGQEIALHFGLWLAVVLALGSIGYWGHWIWVYGMKRVVPRFLRTVAAVIILSATVGGLVASMILTNFNQRYSQEVLSKLTQLVKLVPQVIPTDELMAVQAPSQFGGPEYLDVRNRIIRAVYGADGKDNQGLYFAVHRVNQGRLSTFMYLNGDTTIRHPFSYLDDPEGPYQQALKGTPVAQYALDAWGSWMYATGPIKDASGTTVGVFEMGGDLYSFTQENNRLIQSLLVNIVTVVIVLLLVLIELTFLQDQLKRRTAMAALRAQGLEPRREEEHFYPAFLLRPLTGVFFVGASLSLLFLPLMAKELYQPIPGLPENVVYGLPLSLRLFFFGLGTVVAGNLSSRWGWRPVFLVGVGILAAGLVMASLAPNLMWFFISALPVGLGTGFGMIGLRSAIHAESPGTDSSRSYSHFYAGIIAGTNVGVIVGSSLADAIGFANVFWVATGVTLLAGWLVFSLFPKPNRPAVSTEISATKALAQFFTDPAILRFGLFVILPVYVASMVLYFFFPVFAESQGVSNADMGRVFLLNGLVIVYLGPTLSRFVLRTFGTRGGVIVSTLLWLVSLTPFLLLGDLMGLVLTIVLMGIAEGTAASAQNEHLLSLPLAQRLGPDRMVGNFEVVAKVGETAAPVLIGFAMLAGPRWGVILVGVALALGVILFAVTAPRRSGREEAL